MVLCFLLNIAMVLLCVVFLFLLHFLLYTYVYLVFTIQMVFVVFSISARMYKKQKKHLLLDFIWFSSKSYLNMHQLYSEIQVQVFYGRFFIIINRSIGVSYTPVSKFCFFKHHFRNEMLKNVSFELYGISSKHFYQHIKTRQVYYF